MKKTILYAAVALATATFSASSQAAVLNGSNNSPIEWGSVDSGGVPVAVTQGPATLFPSVITLSGTPAGEVVTGVTVTLNAGTGHTFADDLEISLAYNGTVIYLMSSVGGGDDFTGGGSTTFAAGAPTIPDAGPFPGSGTFDVSVAETIQSPGPAPTGTALSDFNGGSADGDWSLYVFDDAGADTGNFTGWSIEVTTGVIPEPSTGLLMLTGLGCLALRRRRR